MEFRGVYTHDLLLVKYSWGRATKTTRVQCEDNDLGRQGCPHGIEGVDMSAVKVNVNGWCQ